MATRILLVIDPTLAWEGLRRLIQQHACFQLAAETESIPSALELTRRLRPDIVIMDINVPLPEMIRAARCMIEGTPGVRVITLCMQSDGLYAEKCFLSGIAGYLLKDCAYEELIPAIDHVLAGNTYLSPEMGSVGRGVLRP